jgi:hypothetical protein
MFYGTGTMDRQIHRNGTSRRMSSSFFLANTRRARGIGHSAAAVAAPRDTPDVVALPIRSKYNIRSKRPLIMLLKH